MTLYPLRLTDLRCTSKVYSMSGYNKDVMLFVKHVKTYKIDGFVYETIM